MLQFRQPLIEFVISFVKLLNSLADASKTIVHFIAEPVHLRAETFDLLLELRFCCRKALFKHCFCL